VARGRRKGLLDHQRNSGVEGNGEDEYFRIGKGRHKGGNCGARDKKCRRGGDMGWQFQMAIAGKKACKGIGSGLFYLLQRRRGRDAERSGNGRHLREFIENRKEGKK